MSDARRELHAMPDPIPPGDLAAWTHLATLALEAYAQPCAFPEKRDAIQASLEVAELATQRSDRAHQRRAELADPPSDVQDVHRAREENEIEREDADEALELALLDLSVAWGDWSYACVRIVSEEFERNDDDVRVFANLEDEIARLAN